MFDLFCNFFCVTPFQKTYLCETYLQNNTYKIQKITEEEKTNVQFLLSTLPILTQFTKSVQSYKNKEPIDNALIKKVQRVLIEMICYIFGCKDQDFNNNTINNSEDEIEQEPEDAEPEIEFIRKRDAKSERKEEPT